MALQNRCDVLQKKANKLPNRLDNEAKRMRVIPCWEHIQPIANSQIRTSSGVIESPYFNKHTRRGRGDYIEKLQSETELRAIHI